VYKQHWVGGKKCETFFPSFYIEEQKKIGLHPGSDLKVILSSLHFALTIKKNLELFDCP